METKQEGPQPEKPWVRMSILAAAGTQLGAVLGVSAFLGAFLDNWLKTTPWLTVITLGAGFFGGFWNFLRILKRYGSNSGQPDTRNSGDDGNDAGNT